MSSFSSNSLTIPPRPRRWLRLLAALLIFGAGMICGGGLTVMVAVHRIDQAIRHPEEAPARITKYLTRRLDLNPDQAEQVEQLIAARQLRLQNIRREVQPRVESELNELKAQIDHVLTPDQQVKWDQVFDDALDRWLPPPPPAPATQPS